MTLIRQPALVIWLAAVLLFAAAIEAAIAHEFYSSYCCNERDCGPAPGGAVIEGPDGYAIPSLKLTVPYRDKRIRYAPDGQFHLCIVAGELRCLYIPPRGF